MEWPRFHNGNGGYFVSEATRFFNNLLHKMAMSINTSMPCKVVSYNKSKRTAKIQPLFMTKEVGHEPEELPPISDVPVLFQRFEFVDMDNGNNTVTRDFIPVLKKDDVVLVVFSQRALDNAMNGRISYPGIHRHHDLQDAVVVGVLY